MAVAEASFSAPVALAKENSFEDPSINGDTAGDQKDALRERQTKTTATETTNEDPYASEYVDSVAETIAARQDKNQWGTQIDNFPVNSNEDVYSLRAFKDVNNNTTLIASGRATAADSNDRECLLNLIDGATGEVDTEFKPPGVYSDYEDFDVQCTDAIGVVASDLIKDYIIYTGFAEYKEAQVSGRGVRPFLIVSDREGNTIQGEENADILENILETSIEKELSDLASDNSQKFLWSHYPVRLTVVPPELSNESIETSPGEMEIADVILLLASSPTSEKSNRQDIVEKFIARPETDPMFTEREYVPPHKFKYGDVEPMPKDLPEKFQVPGRGMSLLRLRIYVDAGGKFHAEPLWHNYQHSTSIKKNGSTIVPMDVIVTPPGFRDPEKGGYVIVSGYTDGENESLFGDSEDDLTTNNGQTEGFVMRMKVDGGTWLNGLRLAENDIDDIVGGLCFAKPYGRYDGSVFVVGTKARGNRYDAFVQELQYDITNKMRKVQGARSDWGEVSSGNNIYDMWAGSCVAERTGEKVTVYVVGTTGNTGKDLSLGYGMHDAFLLALEGGSLQPTRFNSTAFGTPADDSMHGIIHGGGGILIDPLDKTRLIMAGNTNGDMYSLRSEGQQKGMERMFVRSVNKSTGFSAQTLSQECIANSIGADNGELFSISNQLKCMKVFGYEDSLNFLEWNLTSSFPSSSQSSLFPSSSQSPTSTDSPTDSPTEFPTEYPTETTTSSPSSTGVPTFSPTDTPTDFPTETPTEFPANTKTLTLFPTESPTETLFPTESPTIPTKTSGVVPSIVTNPKTKSLSNGSSSPASEGGGSGFFSAAGFIVGIFLLACAFFIVRIRRRRQNETHQQLIDQYNTRQVLTGGADVEEVEISSANKAAYNLTSDLDVHEELDFDEAKQFTIT